MSVTIINLNIVFKNVNPHIYFKKAVLQCFPKWQARKVDKQKAVIEPYAEFLIWIAVVFQRCVRMSRCIELHILNMCSLLYVNYTSIKMSKNQSRETKRWNSSPEGDTRNRRHCSTQGSLSHWPKQPGRGIKSLTFSQWGPTLFKAM